MYFRHFHKVLLQVANYTALLLTYCLRFLLLCNPLNFAAKFRTEHFAKGKCLQPPTNNLKKRLHWFIISCLKSNNKLVYCMKIKRCELAAETNLRMVYLKTFRLYQMFGIALCSALLFLCTCYIHNLLQITISGLMKSGTSFLLDLSAPGFIFSSVLTSLPKHPDSMMLLQSCLTIRAIDEHCLVFSRHCAWSSGQRVLFCITRPQNCGEFLNAGWQTTSGLSYAFYSAEDFWGFVRLTCGF